MVGKASLLLVLGFSLIFLVFGQRFVSLSGQATDNMVDYYADVIANECAVCIQSCILLECVCLGRRGVPNIAM